MRNLSNVHSWAGGFHPLGVSDSLAARSSALQTSSESGSGPRSKADPRILVADSPVARGDHRPSFHPPLIPGRGTPPPFFSASRCYNRATDDLIHCLVSYSCVNTLPGLARLCLVLPGTTSFTLFPLHYSWIQSPKSLDRKPPKTITTRRRPFRETG